MWKTILLQVELLKKTKKRMEIKEENRENHKKCGNKQMLHVKQWIILSQIELLRWKIKKQKYFPGNIFCEKINSSGSRIDCKLNKCYTWNVL